MHGKSKVEHLWNLVGKSLIDGGDLKVFQIDDLNEFHYVNKHGVNKFTNKWNRVDASCFDDPDEDLIQINSRC